MVAQVVERVGWCWEVLGLNLVTSLLDITYLKTRK